MILLILDEILGVDRQKWDNDKLELTILRYDYLTKKSNIGPKSLRLDEL